jgi:hypothetical protein
MDLLEGSNNGVAKAFSRFDALIATFLCTRVTERCSFDGIGKGRDRSTVINIGLRALGLQLVEDAREVSDLRLREIELVSEEAKWTSNPERSSAASTTKRKVLGWTSSTTPNEVVRSVAGSTFVVMVMVVSTTAWAEVR